MAEPRVGRLRTVSLSGSDYQRKDAFDNASKVKRRTEGYHSAAVLCVSCECCEIIEIRGLIVKALPFV